MPAERVTLNPTAENSALVPLDFVGTDPSWGIYLLSHDYPPPKPEVQRASSTDSEGDRIVSTRYGNRTIPLRLRIVEPEDPASTNLVTNPLAAIATTGWVGSSLVAGPTRVVSPTFTPGEVGIDTAVEAKTDAAADLLYHGGISVTSGSVYRASVYCLLAAKTSTAKLRIVVFNAAGEVKATGEELTATGIAFKKLDVLFTADSTSEWRVGVEQVEAGTTTFFLTGLLVEKTTTTTFRSNLVANPLARTAITGWTGESLAAGPTRVTPETYPPSIVGGTTAISAAGNADQDRMLAALPVASLTAGKTYRASVYVRLSAATGGAGIRLSVRKALLGVVQASSPTNKVLNEWVRLDFSWVAAELEAQRICVEQVGAGTVSFVATGFLFEENGELGPYYPSPGQLEAGEAGWKGAADNAASYFLAPFAGPGPFFCGDSPGCDWSGTRHGSTSTRPAPNGTRFSRIYRDVMRTVDRLKRQQPTTLRRDAPYFASATYDLVGVEVVEAPQDISHGMKRAEIALAFEAEPGCRTAEVLVAEKEETTLPVLSMLAEGVPGDMPGLGRLVLLDKQGVDQSAAWWGQRQRFYDAAASAGLFFEAESRTPLGSSATAALAGASGAGNNTIRNTGLVNAYQGIMSTQASGGGAHLSHVGTYRVLARMQRPTANTGEVTVQLNWAEGDFVNITENDALTFAAGESEGVYTIEDLGLVTLEKAPAGTTQRWEGQIVAKSTVASDDIYVDWLMLVPVDEGSGEIRVSRTPPPPAVISGYDAFNQTAGALTGKSAEIGGVYAGAGDVDDFTINTTTDRAQRTALSDVAGTPRYVTLGATKYTDCAVKLYVRTTNPVISEENRCRLGLLARYVDVNNWLIVTTDTIPVEILSEGGGPGTAFAIRIDKKVAGVKSTIRVAWDALAGVNIYPATVPWSILLELIVTAAGEWRIGANGIPMASGVDTDLGAAGALKEGLVGLFDEKINATAETREYDDFQAWVPSIDAAVYASRSAEIRDDQVRREDRTGVTWGDVAYEGNYLLVPPAGPEKSITQLIAKLSRNAESDGGIDDAKAQLYVQPRWLEAPPL